MGGIGSGDRRERLGRKRRIEECVGLGTGLLVRRDMLRAGQTTQKGLRWGESLVCRIEARTEDLEHAELHLRFTVPGGQQKAAKGGTPPDAETQQIIRLAILRPRFGGLRWLLVCDCGRRASKLYLPPGGQLFACRICHNLAYASSCRSHHIPATHRDFAKRTGLDPRRLVKAVTQLAAGSGPDAAEPDAKGDTAPRECPGPV